MIPDTVIYNGTVACPRCSYKSPFNVWPDQLRAFGYTMLRCDNCLIPIRVGLRATIEEVPVDVQVPRL